MTTTSPKEQTEQSLETAKQKGSQRLNAFAMVDKNSWVSFRVPEWFATICGTKGPNAAQAGTDQWRPKQSTKEAQTGDESLDEETTGTGTKRNIRKSPPGVRDDDTSTKFIGRPVKLYFSSQATNVKKNTKLRRGANAYKTRSIRVHQAMNAMAIKYFLQEVISGGAVSAFTIGKTKYFMGGGDKVELADLGSLRDEEGATTTP